MIELSFLMNYPFKWTNTSKWCSCLPKHVFWLAVWSAELQTKRKVFQMRSIKIRCEWKLICFSSFAPNGKNMNINGGSCTYDSFFSEAELKLLQVPKSLPLGQLKDSAQGLLPLPIIYQTASPILNLSSSSQAAEVANDSKSYTRLTLLL